MTFWICMQNVSKVYRPHVRFCPFELPSRLETVNDFFKIGSFDFLPPCSDYDSFQVVWDCFSGSFMRPTCCVTFEAPILGFSSQHFEVPKRFQQGFIISYKICDVDSGCCCFLIPSLDRRYLHPGATWNLVSYLKSMVILRDLETILEPKSETRTSHKRL